jgi:hypothetical protein
MTISEGMSGHIRIMAGYCQIHGHWQMTLPSITTFLSLSTSDFSTFQGLY